MKARIYQLSLVAVVLIWIGAGQVAMAQVAPMYAWLLKIDFHDSQTRARLILHEYENNQVSQEVVIDFSETCASVGNVLISKDNAQFYGDGYIQCAVPHIAHEFFTHFGATVPPAALSEQAWAAASLTDNSVGPIFSYDTMDFDVNSNGKSRVTTLSLGNQAFQQAYYSKGSSAPHPRLWVGKYSQPLFDYIQTSSLVGDWAASYKQLPPTPPNFAPQNALVYLDGVTWNIDDENVSQFPVTSDATMVYVGFNPTTEANFEGTIFEVGADPGIRQH